MQPQNPTNPIPETPLAPGVPPQQVQPANPAAPMAPQPQKGGVPTWVKIIVGVFVGFIILGGVLFATVMKSTSAPLKISNQFIDNVQASNSDVAYQLTNQTFKDATSTDDMQTFVESIGTKIQGDEKVADRRIQKPTGTSASAIFIYTAGTSEGMVYIKTMLKEKDGAWQVLSMLTDNNPLTIDSE